MNTEYKEYYEKWLSGLEDEIEFWKLYMEEKGGIYFHGYEETVSPKKRFTLENDIPVENYGKDCLFIDVGSGPFSRCGQITDRVNLRAVSMDPLAGIYKILKERNHIDNCIRLESGFVELLSRDIPENTFDLVHMSNSLDHSFDAVYGIYQLLYICKIGGKVILRHAENEAERGNYSGLHQWNLSLHNRENAFVIWRNEERYNISELFKEYAEIELYPDSIEPGGWVHNKVVLIKRKEIKIPEKDYYNEMLKYTYDFLLRSLLKTADTKKRKEPSENELRCRKIRDIFYENITSVKISSDIKCVDIYGLGLVGKAFYQLMKKYGIRVGQLIDRNLIQYDGRTTLPFEKYRPAEELSRVVITANDDKQAILGLLSTKVETGRIVYIDDFLSSMQ